MKRYGIAVICTIALAAVLAAGCGDLGRDAREAERSIDAGDLERHVLALASDEFEGRAPFTRGEEKTVEYIKSVFENMGLEGANNGAYFQDVPLVEIKGRPSDRMRVATMDGSFDLRYLQDFIASTSRVVPKTGLEQAACVFAGYGITAPEYGWDDYAGLDTAGKAVFVLVNDPGFAGLDASLFNGRAMTYYGRWTYKYEEAARRGAAGVFVIHDTAGAGYPWTVLRSGAGVNLVLGSEDNNMSCCAVEGWLTTEAARRIFQAAGKDFDSLVRSAALPGFKPVELGATVTLSIENDLRHETSRNVMAVLRGSGRSDECVVYTAHWDHLGIGPAVDGDSIYNGAADNAIPVACMLETARAFSRLDMRPSRSVLFIAVTAEESGLLGSAYYVAHPVFPLAKTVAVLNYELFLPLGRMKDVTVYGYGQSELDDYVARAAKKQGRYVAPDASPENGMYFRTDHFSFARAGVPALFIKGWSDHAERGPEWTREKIEAFWTDVYHTPGDEYDPETADLSGIVDDAKLFFAIGHELAAGKDFPEWREGSQFRKAREQAKRR
jgi:Zn-dependent M28 family amino/carboxypeptidase